MREKLYKVLQKCYGILMTVSFFAGVLPLLPFIFAIIVGGELGESVAVFLHKEYYPWVILVGSVAIVIGLVAMYVGKLKGLSVKSVTANDKGDNENPQKD